MKRKYFVFDLECVPEENMPSWKSDIIEDKIKNKRGDNKDAIKYASLNAEMGKIIVITIYDSETDKCFVLSGDENTILQSFWDYYKEHIGTTIVGFNSKRFDSVYISKRSCILNINNYGLNIPNRRYDTIHHFDCLEILSNFYTTEMFALDVYCKLYGVHYENDNDGSEILELYQAGKFDEIYTKCLNDVKATNALYKKIYAYM